MTGIVGIDGHEAQARLLPSVVAGLPLLLAVLFCFPELRGFAPSAALAALLFGLGPIVSEFANGRDKNLDHRLREKGAGPLLLTWADPEIVRGLKKEMRAALAKSFPDFPLLNPQEEKLETNAARNLCADLVGALAPSYRDWHKYPVIHAALTSFRFRMNVLRLRTFAVASCRWGALLGLICAIFAPPGTAPMIISLLGAGLCTAAAIFYDKTITLNWVCNAEREYVKQMLLSVVSAARASEGKRWAVVESLERPQKLATS